jgi:hypothetical protein
MGHRVGLFGARWRSRTPRLVWICATAGWLLALNSCSWIVGDIPGPLRDAGTPNGGSGSGGTHGTRDGNAGTDAAPPLVASDAGGDAEAHVSHPPGTGDAGSDPCDRDGDHEQGPQCGGPDCDDSDRNVFSTQERYFDQPNPNVHFDYNCNGSIERQYPQGLSCSVEMGLCNTQSQGFLDNPLPACGAEGAWGHCVAQQIAGLPTTCAQQVDEMRRVACH